MNVGDEMDKKLEGFDPIGSRFVLVGQDSPEYFDAVNHAIMVVGFRLWMLFTTAIAISGLGETGGSHGDVYEMPTEGFRTLGPDLIRPG